MILTLWRMGEEGRLSVFTVHEEPNPAADRIDRAERLAFLRDGFSWSAALWAPVWLLQRRLWVPLAVYAAAVAAIGLVFELFDFGGEAMALAITVLHLIIGYESYQLERWSYEARGFTLAGTVTGRSKSECERRFFETWLPSQPVISAPARSTTGTPSSGTMAASAGQMQASSAAGGQSRSMSSVRQRLFGGKT
ncbi:MAG: hypothetical protein CTY20_04720 [Hyphomicrobium sp.]|nr:MAG: hypothetical protein CTY20_04720 [Hyphomicrobium sp.]